MRFKAKPTPKFWDKVKCIEFAYLPKLVEDHWIWLEKYEATYRYERDSFWNYSYWELIDKKLIDK